MMSVEKVICRRVSDGVLINIPHTFDLKQIADSGQCFRLTALQDRGYVAITGMKLVKITPSTNGGYVFHCPYPHPETGFVGDGSDLYYLPA